MSIRPIWNKPTLVSEWEDEEQEERETYWISLFYDLIMVAGVSAISDPFDVFVARLGSHQMDSPRSPRVS